MSFVFNNYGKIFNYLSSSFRKVSDLVVERIVLVTDDSIDWRKFSRFCRHHKLKKKIETHFTHISKKEAKIFK